MTEIRYCVGGPWERRCTTFGQHEPDCQAESCRGCAPRLATEGHLCASCDTYLRQWLDVSGDEPKPNSLRWVHWWLGESQARRDQLAPRWDSGRGSADDMPSPIREAILDCRQQLEDRVEAIEANVREKIDRTQPAHMPPFRWADALAYLASRLLRIEDDPDIMRAAWEDLQDSMVSAHMLAPWRPKVERIAGIPCPNCERVSLVIEGGDDFCTCRSCGTTVVSRRFDQWVAMLDHERGA